MLCQILTKLTKNNLYKIPAKTLFLGKRLIYVPQCHSTNEIAAQIVDQSSVAEGTTVITDRQLKGKGQWGNSWITEDFKNLTFSIVLKPTFLALGNRFYLNIIIALGVRKAVSTLLKTPVWVKWPNDIMTERGKLAGILIENQLQGQTIAHSVAGVGLNVNQLEFSIPSATSLAIVSGDQFALPQVLETLMECIEAYYLMLRQGALESLKVSYEASLYWKDELHTFATAEETFKGIIKGVDADGQLQVESEGGVRHFNIKQVRYIA